MSAISIDLTRTIQKSMASHLIFESTANVASRGNVVKQVGQCLRNVARHVLTRIGRDVTPDFLLASNRHTAKFADGPAVALGPFSIVLCFIRSALTKAGQESAQQNVRHYADSLTLFIEILFNFVVFTCAIFITHPTNNSYRVNTAP